MNKLATYQSTLRDAGLPAVLTTPVSHWLDNIGEDRLQQFSSRDADRTRLIRLLASSEFAAGVIARNWDWFSNSHSAGEFASIVDTASLQTMAAKLAARDCNTSDFKSQLRRIRDRQLVHILWRSMGADDEVWDSLHSLSDLADELIKASANFARRTLVERFGNALNGHGDEISLVILAMGKLGGRELNFSSDIDLIFLYAEEGETNGPRVLSAHEYFTRLCRLIVNLIDEVTEDGFVYRVDTRLRPFGESGPPVVSFAALENYLLQHGRGWERYAYVKARAIDATAPAGNSKGLLEEVIYPFVYRRYLDYGVFESLREMKSLISTEVRTRELKNNIKLGDGGIREVEFIVQSLQLVRGGADLHLRCSELRAALEQLGRKRGLGREAESDLRDSYCFLRKLENGIQAIRDQQTHDIPEKPDDQARLQLVMGFSSWASLSEAIAGHRNSVSEHFAGIAFRTENESVQTELASALSANWNAGATVADWEALLEKHGFEDAAKIAVVVTDFAVGSIQGQADATAARRVARFMQAFLLSLKGRRNPGIVCARVLAVISKILRRSAYVALLNENPAVLDRLVSLCAQSAYLAEEIARFPLLLDELLDPRLYAAEISRSSMRTDIDERLKQFHAGDSEQKIEILAQFQRATLFRIAVADISATLPIMKVSDRLTDLAELVLEIALEVAWSDLAAIHGVPLRKSADGARKAGFGIIAYGKFGGMELSYRSDLDLVFLHDSAGDPEETKGPKPLENSVFFGRLVRRLVHFLTAQTPSGALYDIDTRLRPSGASGLLVVNTDSFEKYQEQNAWTWEQQALLRARPVAGSANVAREFERIRADTLQNRVRRERLLNDVVSMRQKMREQLDMSATERFDLKQGEGGIGDIEFLVQYLVLKNANTEVALIHYSDNIRQLGTLAAAGFLQASEVASIQDIYRSYRLRMHRLALDGKPTTVNVAEFVEERRTVSALWQREMG